jgi:hypothetical protein
MQIWTREQLKNWTERTFGTSAASAMETHDRWLSEGRDVVVFRDGSSEWRDDGDETSSEVVAVVPSVAIMIDPAPAAGGPPWSWPR